jgi:histidinol-phosphate aminotransferase
MALLDALPAGTLLCLDEAYADLAPPDAIPALDPSDDRVIRMRTFSKAHGLAGLRVGYAIGHAALIGAFDRVRNHFGLGRVAQAGARAALADTAWLAEVQARVAQSRDRLAAIAQANGLTPLPSATNFVTMDCGRDGDFARRVMAGLIERGVFVRMPGVAPLDRCIRVSCGTEADMEAFASRLPEALAHAKS